MPVDNAIGLGDVNLYQTTATRPDLAGAGQRGVGGAVGGAHQPLAGGVEKTVGLVVHFHRHMGASVQVGDRYALKAHGKGAAGLASVHHVKRHRDTTVNQVFGVAQGNYLGHGRVQQFRR